MTISAQDIAGALGLPRPTDEQASIIEHPPTPMLVVAGAGSGKTETMSARVVWLVANGHVEPDRVAHLYAQGRRGARFSRGSTAGRPPPGRHLVAH